MGGYASGLFDDWQSRCSIDGSAAGTAERACYDDRLY
jgi:hypothetical protein